MALTMLAMALPAAAVTGFDSKYSFESDFVSINPGETKQFTVGFINTGTTGWQKGASSQVDLAQCCPYNTSSANSAWNPGTWLSGISYATTTEAFVAPGGSATFSYSIKAPASATAGTYRFSGDLAKADTRDMIHPEGYYQEATISSTAGQPTQLVVSPKFQSRVVGTTATVNATVTAEPPSGSTTRTPLSGVNVTFILDACPHAVDDGGCGVNNSLVDNNPDAILTATTNSAGVATINYTRVNPGNDRIDAYVTGAPAVRDQGTVSWGIAAAITVTPDDSVSLVNTACRSYTVTQKDPSTGATTTNPLFANFVENINATSDQDGGATINGVSPTSPNTGVSIGTGGTVSVCGAGTSNKTVTIIAFDNNGGGVGTALESGDRSDTGGSITFVAATPTFTVTPDTASTAATGGQVVYTVTATDQFGNPWTKAGGATLGFVETTDNLASTTTSAVISWYDADGTDNTTAAAGCATAPAGTTASGAQQVTITLDSTGKATFAVCSTTATTGTPVAWYDANANTLREADERQDTGGSVTWVTAAVTSAKMSPSSATNGTSTAGDTTDNGSRGEETYTFSFSDQSGNPVSPSSNTTVTFTVQNTGSNPIYITNCDGPSTSTQVAAGASSTACTATITSGGDTSATIEVDAPFFTSGSASATITGSGGGLSATGTKTWINANDEPTAACNQVSGTVISVDKTDSGTDNGSYIIQTTVAGNFFITYSFANDTFIVQGTTVAGQTFEDALSVGDTVTYTVACPTAVPPSKNTHNMTTNVP